MSAQLSIDWNRAGQSEQLGRVGSRIGAAIYWWCRNRYEGGLREFRAEELRRHVEVAAGSSAPGSADRILRQLRQQGHIRYSVVDRAKSTYRLEGWS